MNCRVPDDILQSEEGQLQLIFIILHNLAQDDATNFKKVLKKLYDMGRFFTRFTTPEELSKLINQACLIGQYITPVVIKWAEDWMDASIRDEVFQDFESHRDISFPALI